MLDISIFLIILFSLTKSSSELWSLNDIRPATVTMLQYTSLSFFSQAISSAVFLLTPIVSTAS